MNVEELFDPVLLVVGESFEEFEVELVTMFSCLTRAVLDPPKLNDMVDDVSKNVIFDEFPCQPFSCEPKHNDVTLCTQYTICTQHTNLIWLGKLA